MSEVSGRRIWVAGHNGMVGSSISRALTARGAEVIGWSSSELDLRERAATFDAAMEARPDCVVLAAARVGGIAANEAFPVQFLTDNIRIQTNVMEAAHAAEVPRLLFIGSSCIYPREATQPMTPDQLFTGPLEPTNDAYAIAKIAGLYLVRAFRRQYGRSWISCLPTNLYGAGDDFDPETSHVMAALIRRFEEAMREGTASVTVWGSGTPRRELLHVDDLASACIRLLDVYDDAEAINIGTGEDVTIAQLANTVARVVGFEGSIEWDTSRPDGMPRKLLDVRPLRALGWAPSIGLEEGIRATHAWYVSGRA